MNAGLLLSDKKKTDVTVAASGGKSAKKVLLFNFRSCHKHIRVIAMIHITQIRC